MSARLVKLVLCWNLALSVLLLISLAGNATLIQAANDPPVRVYSANVEDQAAGGTATQANNLIDGTLPDQLLLIVTSNLSANHPHTCTVIASAQANYDENGKYLFAISMDSHNSVTAGSERRIELFNNPGIEDDSYEEVSSVYTYYDVMGAHDFRWTARKLNASQGNMVVDSASMSVICIKKKF